VDREPEESAVLRFAREQSLPVYDAAYLELAHREKLPIATPDLRLRDAARAVRVEVR
jgi:predicted nucleic acid-binding protein